MVALKNELQILKQTSCTQGSMQKAFDHAPQRGIKVSNVKFDSLPLGSSARPGSAQASRISSRSSPNMIAKIFGNCQKSCKYRACGFCFSGYLRTRNGLATRILTALSIIVESWAQGCWFGIRVEKTVKFRKRSQLQSSLICGLWPGSELHFGNLTVFTTCLTVFFKANLNTI